MNKVTIGSQMYPFLNDWSGGKGYTWNPIRGKCPHNCVYCYMKIWKQNELRFVEKEIDLDLGDSKYIFVGSSTDMWCKDVPDWWIDSVLACCRLYPQNTYLFQTKNPAQFKQWETDFPPKSIIGITLESNRAYLNISHAPLPLARVTAFQRLNLRKMVSIEPILDFDVDLLVSEIKCIAPEFVSIGADSQHHHLPEPSPDKVQSLIAGLEKITQVIQKDNLKRLLAPDQIRKER